MSKLNGKEKGYSNLIPLNKRSKEERHAIQSKGGKTPSVAKDIHMAITGWKKKRCHKCNLLNVCKVGQSAWSDDKNAKCALKYDQIKFLHALRSGEWTEVFKDIFQELRLTANTFERKERISRQIIDLMRQADITNVFNVQGDVTVTKIVEQTLADVPKAKIVEDEDGDTKKRASKN